MALKGQISLTILSVSILALELSLRFFPAVPAPTGTIGARPVRFREIAAPVVTANPEIILRGVSIHDADDFPVVQLPPGNTNYVSKNDGEITQFASANQYGNIGLLAR